MKRFLVLAIAAALAALSIAGGTEAGISARHVAQGPSQYVPTWSWKAAATGTTPAGSTFARASSRTCIDATPKIVTLSSNVPCFDHDPLTAAPLGYLDEMQSTNKVIYSQDFSQSSWTSFGSGVTIGATTTAPDGTNTAQLLTLQSVSGYVEAVGGNAGRFANNDNLGASIYIKAVTTTGTLGIKNQNGTGFGQWTVDLSKIGSGWQRLTPNHPAVTVNSPFIATSTGQGGFEYFNAGTTAIQLYPWGVQLEGGGVGITSYIPTSGAAATRAADILSLPLSSMSGWNAGLGGVLVATYRLYTLVPTSPGFNQAVVDLRDSGSNIVEMLGGYAGTNVVRNFVFVGGVLKGDLDAGPASSAPFVRRRDAMGWGVPRAAHAVDGAFVVGVNTLTALPSGMTTAYFGGDGGSQELNGAVEEVDYYAGVRPDGLLDQVSHP